MDGEGDGYGVPWGRERGRIRMGEGGGLEQEEGTGKGDEKDKNQERDQYWRLYRMYSVRRKIVKIMVMLIGSTAHPSYCCRSDGHIFLPIRPIQQLLSCL